jgi:hypothetical protein
MNNGPRILALRYIFSRVRAALDGILSAQNENTLFLRGRHITDALHGMCPGFCASETKGISASLHSF